MSTEVIERTEAYRLMERGLPIQIRDAGGEWHDMPCSWHDGIPHAIAEHEGSRYRVKPDGTERVHFWGSPELADGCSNVYLGATVPQMLMAVADSMSDWTPEDCHGTEIRIWTRIMTDAEVAALPEI